MYKYRSKQISLTDFNTPVGMKLNPDNRWVKKAELIPWDEIEQRYAKLFTNRKGNVAKPLRLALGACIIQAEYGYSDEEVALQIQETAYLQFFCGYSEYNDEKLPFDPSLMVYFRKRLTPEILGETNEMIIQNAETEVERKFSLAKRKCGIGLIVTRLKETTCHCLAMSVLLLNLRKIGKVLLAEILKLLQNLFRIYSFPEMAIIQ